MNHEMRALSAVLALCLVAPFAQGGDKPAAGDDPALQALEKQLPPEKLKQFYRDLDNDGISDILDECPNTPPNVKVDIIGCEVDEDGDGVGDSRDQCPGTPPHSRVNLLGCPVNATADADGDGVLDQADRCPGTPSNVPVDNQGCPASQAPSARTSADSRHSTVKTEPMPSPAPEAPPVEAEATIIGTMQDPVTETAPAPSGAPDQRVVVHLTFDTGSYHIRHDQRPRLDRALRQLNKTSGNQVILISGHTDAIGCQDDNLKLSWNRAWAVKQYLVSKGYDSERIFIIGYGEARPIANNWTPEGRKRNRRIELSVTDTVPEEAQETLPPSMRGYVRRPGRCPLPDDK